MSQAMVTARTTETGPPTLHVVFKVGSTDYALPVDVVLQMETFSDATPVPGADPFVVGILQLRGRVIPIIDLRARFGLPSGVPGPERRVVVGEHEGRVVALLADTAREVVQIAPGQLQPPPMVAAGSSRGFVRAVAQMERRMILVLDFAKVIGEEPIDVERER